MSPAVVFLIAALGADVVALGVTVAVLAEALADLRAVNRAGIVNGRRVVAVRAVQAEAIRVVIVVVIGTAAGFAAWASTGHGRLWALLALALFLAATILVAVDSVLALRFRRELTRSHRPDE